MVQEYQNKQDEFNKEPETSLNIMENKHKQGDITSYLWGKLLVDFINKFQNE